MIFPNVQQLSVLLETAAVDEAWIYIWNTE